MLFQTWLFPPVEHKRWNLMYRVFNFSVYNEIQWDQVFFVFCFKISFVLRRIENDELCHEQNLKFFMNYAFKEMVNN